MSFSPPEPEDVRTRDTPLLTDRLFTDRVRAESFGDDPEQYDRARPSYPDVLVDDLVRDQPRSVLDVGCGTGIASRLLTARGCKVVGLEPDARMAALARCDGTEVIVTPFEGWDREGRTFDLLASAQAWHWIDPTVGAALAADVLHGHGRIALFWNLGRPDPLQKSTFDAIYRAYAPGLEGYSVLLGSTDTTRFANARAGIEASGAFEATESRSFRHTVHYSAESWLDHLPTHSDHRGLDADVRAALFAKIGVAIEGWGGLDMAYETLLISARRRLR